VCAADAPPACPSSTRPRPAASSSRSTTDSPTWPSSPAATAAARLEWCLPKGHLEGEETAEQAAVREISEETGIDGRVLRHLGSIDYWFAGTDRRVHKVVHHYLLEATGGYLTTENDPDQEAEQVAWVRLDKVASRLAYPNERRVVATARDVLAGRA
jgi:8-oxo-dGTP pyrophosphatase MutT (NUDIX family)